MADVIEVQKTTRWVAKPSGRGGRSKVCHEARVGDLVERADTAAEARAALGTRLWSAMTHGYNPRVLRFGGWTAIIWREPGGYGVDWGYQLIGPEFDGVTTLYSAGGYKDVHEAERRARASIGSNMFSYDDPLAGLAVIEEDEDRHFYLSQSSFSMRYKALKDAGYEGRIHETAGGLDRWPEHIPRPADLTDPRVKEPVQ